MAQKKNKNRSYWRGRSIEMEDYSQKMVDENMRQLKKLYRSSYSDIEVELNALLLELQEVGVISRSDVYRAKRYGKLIDVIDREVGYIDVAQREGLALTLDKILDYTVTSISEDIGFPTTIFKNQVKQIVNTNWSGEHFSSRIWNNTQRLSSRVKDLITQEIVLGKNPNEIKKALMREFDVSYNIADRLQRTEAAYVHNKACIESYKQSGVVTEVKFLAEVDCCDICAKDRGQRFKLGEEPTIPRHPSCRCSYIPIVEV